MLELYHWEPTLESAKVMIGLKEKGLDFTSHYVDILGLEQYSKDFLAVNEAGQVPVLVHDGNVLTDSTLINEYLEEAFPDIPLAPRDARGWYDTLCWGKYVEYNLDTSVSTLGWHQVMEPVMKQRDVKKLKSAIEGIPLKERQTAWSAALDFAYTEDQLENSRRKIGLAIQRMEDTLKQNEWLMGAAYSIIDIDAFALARTLPQLVPDIVNDSKVPAVMAWLQKIQERPAVQAALALGKADADLYAPGPEHSRWG